MSKTAKQPERDPLTLMVLDLADHVLDESDLYELIEKKREERDEVAAYEVPPSEGDGIPC